MRIDARTADQMLAKRRAGYAIGFIAAFYDCKWMEAARAIERARRRKERR